MSENIRNGPDQEQVKQSIFEYMKVMIEKDFLSVQVFILNVFFLSSFIFHYAPQDIVELHKRVAIGSQEARPGCIRDECVVVGDTGQKGGDFTVFLPASEVAAALHLLVEVLLQCLFPSFANIQIRQVLRTKNS